MVDTDSQLITAVDVLPGNAPDNLGALELVERSEANTGVPVEETLGDAAYGDGDTRQAFADAGRTLIARVPGRPDKAHFPKEDAWRRGCTCFTRTIRKSGRRQTHQLFRFRRSAEVPAAAPIVTNGATAPAGGTIAAGPRPAAERGLCRIP